MFYQLVLHRFSRFLLFILSQHSIKARPNRDTSSFSFDLQFRRIMARFTFQLLTLNLLLVSASFALFSSSSKLKEATKYQLQQKVLTLGSSYMIKDDKDKPIYKVR